MGIEELIILLILLFPLVSRLFGGKKPPPQRRPPPQQRRPPDERREPGRRGPVTDESAEADEAMEEALREIREALGFPSPEPEPEPEPVFEAPPLSEPRASYTPPPTPAYDRLDVEQNPLPPIGERAGSSLGRTEQVPHFDEPLQVQRHTRSKYSNWISRELHGAEGARRALLIREVLDKPISKRRRR